MERRNLKQSCVAILITVLLGMVGGKAVAHDIAVANQGGVTIYYSWINNNTELAVSFQGDSYDAYADEYSGCVVIPESVVYGGRIYKVTSIGSYAFYNCMGVTSVTIPGSVESFGDGAFSRCPNLAIIYAQTKEPVIFESSASNAFGAEIFQQTTVYVPIGSKSKYEGANVWKRFSNIIERETLSLGDVNSDGTINAVDVKEVENYIMGSSSENFNEKAADANEDGSVNAADIVTIANIMRHADTSDKLLLWFLVTNRDLIIPMSQVGMLAATDDSPYFSVLDINGNVLAEDVLRVHFLKLDPASVKNTKVSEPQNMLKRYVNNQLTLVGAQGTVNVYSVSGVKVASATALDKETLIDVSALLAGIYNVKCGKQSFMFNKK